MPNFYRNPSHFLYNNIYRKNFIPLNYKPFFSSTSNHSALTNNTLQNNTDNYPQQNNHSDSKANINLPPNKDFVIDLFGLKLYFDDVLILSLLFFLYKENVKDEGLFLALVLLLIS